MFGRGKKYRMPPHLLPAMREFREFKEPITQVHVRLTDGRQFVVRIWYPDRICAIRGYTYLPFSGCDIEHVYQTEEDKAGGPREAEFMYLDEGALSPFFSLPRWRLKLREIMNWMRGKREGHR